MTEQFQNAGPYINPTSRWALFQGNYIVEITYSSFTAGGVLYPQQKLVESTDQELYALGLYKITTQVMPDHSKQIYCYRLNNQSDWIVDHENKLITMTFTKERHRWQDIKVYIDDEIKLLLNEFAAKRGYENLTTAVTYINSANETFRIEAQRCISIRDEYWTAVNTVIQQVEANQRPPLESLDEIIGGLSPLVW